MLHFVYRNVGESDIEYCNSSTYYLYMYNINRSASSAGLTMVQVVDGSHEPGLRTQGQWRSQKFFTGGA